MDPHTKHFAIKTTENKKLTKASQKAIKPYLHYNFFLKKRKKTTALMISLNITPQEISTSTLSNFEFKTFKQLPQNSMNITVHSKL